MMSSSPDPGSLSKALTIVDGSGEAWRMIGADVAVLMRSLDHPEWAPVWMDSGVVGWFDR
jgi:hypothetical protein